MGESRISRYLLLHFNQLFFPLFLTLMFISSVILFIKVSGLTKVVQVSFSELFLLYLYSLPAVLFFTIPVTFFAACVIALAKLCYDYELPVLFALGMSPSRILRVFGMLGASVSFVLLLLSLGMVPLSKQLYHDFIQSKRSTANVNVKATEFGQKFGDWMIFINRESSREGQFEDVVLFSPKSFGSESVLLAHKAQILSDQEGVRLVLEEGKGFMEQNRTLHQIDYARLTLADPGEIKEGRFTSVLEYWLEALDDPKRAKDLCTSFLTSLFPLLALFLIPALGIHNPRFHKNRSYFSVIAACGLFYLCTYAASYSSPLAGMLTLPPLWLLLSYGIYRWRVVRYY